MTKDSADAESFSLGEWEVPTHLVDAWLERVFRVMAPHLQASGFEIQQGDSSKNTYLVAPISTSATSSLEIEQRPGADSIRVNLRDHEDQNEATNWRSALDAATTSLLGPEQEFRWSAIINPEPETSPYQARKLGDGAITIGNVVLTTSPHRLVEYIQVRPSYNQRKVAVTWPARASGSVFAHDFRQAITKASLQVRHICALLSLVSADCWTIRIGPLAGFDLEAQFPDLTDEVIGSGIHLENYGDSPDLEIPPWLDSAVTTLGEDPKLEDSLIAYHEALLLMPSHPSMALIAFVAAIESIGSRHVELTPCQCCGDCPAEGGYARRFRKTLARVLHRKEIDYIGDVYDLRSRTAHDGTLFGLDRFPGLATFTAMLSVEQGADFERVLYILRRACSRLLILELGGPESWEKSASDLQGGLVGAVVTFGPPSQEVEQVDPNINLQ